MQPGWTKFTQPVTACLAKLKLALVRGLTTLVYCLRYSLPARLLQILLGVDQLVNTILGGWADESFSSRCWRLDQKGFFWWRLWRMMVDQIFFFQHNHCQSAYESEMLRTQSPPQERPTPAEAQKIKHQLEKDST